MTRLDLNPVLQAALVYAQFDTIRPFYEGNGRVCRALVNLLLVSRKAISKPVLPLSVFLARNHNVAETLLMSVRTKDELENWLKFFSIGVEETATNTISAITFLLHRHAEIAQLMEAFVNTDLLVYLSIFPLITVQLAANYLGCSFATARKILQVFADKGIVFELTQQKRNRLYMFREYLDFWKNWRALPNSICKPILQSNQRKISRIPPTNSLSLPSQG